MLVKVFPKDWAMNCQAGIYLFIMLCFSVLLLTSPNSDLRKTKEYQKHETLERSIETLSSRLECLEVKNETELAEKEKLIEDLNRFKELLHKKD